MKLTCCSFYIHVYVIVSQLPRLHLWGVIACIRTVLFIPQRITWHVLGSQPPQTVSRLNNHMTVHFQSKAIIWSCGKNTRAVLVPGLTWSPYPRLISKHWKGWWTADVCWIVSVVHNKDKSIQGMGIDTKKTWSGTLNEWILTFVHVIKCWCGQLISSLYSLFIFWCSFIFGVGILL